MRRHSPYNYAFDNPIRFVDPDGMAPAGCCGTPGPGISGNPLQTLANGIKQYMEVVGGYVDKAFASVTGKVGLILDKNTNSTTSVELEGTVAGGTNLGRWLKSDGAEPMHKFSLTGDITLNTKNEIKGNIDGVDVKVSVTKGISLITGDVITTKELFVGKETKVDNAKTEIGIFGSNKKNSSGSKTDVGSK